MRTVNALLAVAGLTLSAVAFAGPQCTDQPKSDWMSEEAMKQKIAEQGYTVDKFKTTDGNCYEIYGKDKDGKKVEIYFSPIDGSVVKEKRG
ncbi:PepSY domain-containing protein [Azoarcus sp. PA01]|nr:PepSY domain-containing protein [Azoarcus sp. PA01]